MASTSSVDGRIAVTPPALYSAVNRLLHDVEQSVIDSSETPAPSNRIRPSTITAAEARCPRCQPGFAVNIGEHVMTATAGQHATIMPILPPEAARVCLSAARAERAVLDGGWWPRSSDLVAELPGLILALRQRYGPIRQVILNGSIWDNRFRRLAVDHRVIRVGWFSSLDPALAIATADNGDQLDLLVVPLGTDEVAARAAMAQAADPTNTTRAPVIVAAMGAASGQAPVDAPDTDAGSAWDNEGGHQKNDRPPRGAQRHSTSHSKG